MKYARDDAGCHERNISNTALWFSCIFGCVKVVTDSIAIENRSNLTIPVRNLKSLFTSQPALYI